MMATVYLIHLDVPFGHALHYIGFSERMEARITHHRNGTGAWFLKKVNEAGISWQVVRTWANQDRAFERKLKNFKKSKCLCPVCNPEKFNRYGKSN
jgi:predicted GIY-YIG superfamily endonuclease